MSYLSNNVSTYLLTFITNFIFVIIPVFSYFIWTGKIISELIKAKEKFPSRKQSYNLNPTVVGCRITDNHRFC